jgi:hypothetical protein
MLLWLRPRSGCGEGGLGNRIHSRQARQHSRTESVMNEGGGNVECRPDPAVHGETAPWNGHEQWFVEKEVPQQGGSNLFCQPARRIIRWRLAKSTNRPFFLERAYELLRSTRHLTRPARCVDEERGEPELRKQLLPAAEARAVAPEESARRPPADGLRT